MVVQSLIALTRERPPGQAVSVVPSLAVSRVETGSVVLSDGTTTCMLPLHAVSPGPSPVLVSVRPATGDGGVHLSAAGELRLEALKSGTPVITHPSWLPGESLDAWALGPGLWTLFKSHPRSTVVAHARHDGLEATAALHHHGAVRIRRGVDGNEVLVGSVDELAEALAAFATAPPAERMGHAYARRAQLVDQLRGSIVPGSRTERELVRFLSHDVVARFRAIAGSPGLVAGDRMRFCWNDPWRPATRSLLITLRQPASVLVTVRGAQVVPGEFEVPLAMLPPGQVARAGMVLGLWREPR